MDVTQNSIGRRPYRKNRLNRAWSGSMVIREDLHCPMIVVVLLKMDLQPGNQFEQPFLHNGGEEEENIFSFGISRSSTVHFLDKIQRCLYSLVQRVLRKKGDTSRSDRRRSNENKSTKLAYISTYVTEVNTESRCSATRESLRLLLFIQRGPKVTISVMWIGESIRSYATVRLSMSFFFSSLLRYLILLFICIRLCCFVQRINLNDIVYLW